jgi:hypothetical protein
MQMTAKQREFFSKPTGTVDALVETKLIPLSRNGHFDAVKRNEIPAARFGKRIVILTGPLRQKLGL